MLSNIANPVIVAFFIVQRRFAFHWPNIYDYIKARVCTPALMENEILHRKSKSYEIQQYILASTLNV